MLLYLVLIAVIFTAFVLLGLLTAAFAGAISDSYAPTFDPNEWVGKGEQRGALQGDGRVGARALPHVQTPPTG